MDRRQFLIRGGGSTGTAGGGRATQLKFLGREVGNEKGESARRTFTFRVSHFTLFL